MPTNTAVTTSLLFGRVHALWMLIASAASLALDPWLAAAGGALSLVTWIALRRGHWTPSGRFGAANALTLFRLALTVSLTAPWLRPPGSAAALLVLAIFTLDGVDGWLARRNGEASIFGAYFDMECDALLVLVCTLMLYHYDRLPAFILLPGVLRYLYLLVLMVVPAQGQEAPRSRLGRYSFSVLVISLIASLWPLGPWHRQLALLATIFLLYSFGRSALAALRPA